MSSDYHRPTYTLKDLDGNLKAYNPTEVRLYGISGEFGITTVAPGAFEFDVPGSRIRMTVEPNGGGKSQKKGSPMHGGPSLIAIASKETDQNVMLVSFGTDGSSLEAGVIFGYSYEGHCYDLPKPKIMLIPAKGMEVPADDCGYDVKPEEYRVWVVDKLSKCIEIEVNQGFVEQLVLESNMPGKRSPSTYRATMALAHRSGRLTE